MCWWVATILEMTPCPLLTWGSRPIVSESRILPVASIATRVLQSSMRARALCSLSSIASTCAKHFSVAMRITSSSVVISCRTSKIGVANPFLCERHALHHSEAVSFIDSFSHQRFSLVIWQLLEIVSVQILSRVDA